MISLLALDKNDGWLLARDGGNVVLQRPPYAARDAVVATEGMAVTSVTRHGYTAYSREFAGWPDVVAFARAEVLKQRQADERPLPHAGVGREFLAWRAGQGHG